VRFRPKLGYNPAVQTPKSLEDLSVEQLRFLLMEKRRKMRHEKLEHFRRTGRVVTLASDVPLPLETTLSPLQDQSTELPASPPRRRRLADNLLLVIEVCAVVGLVLILLSGLDVLSQLNKEFAQGLVQPTLTPTPLFAAVVLPSGHTPPNAAGGSRPNEDEIPAHLKPLVQSITQVTIPTPGPEQAIRIQIPAIAVEKPIVQGDEWEQLKMGVGQHISSADPGEKGNVVLSAHDDIYGEIFKNLDRLKPGDQVILFTNQRSYTYVVMSNPQIVEPTQVEFLSQTAEPIVTLISCYPYLVDNKRIIVQAYLQSGN
jgi:sortase A